MAIDLGDYQCQFTVEERKGLISQMLREFRVGAGLSQKEVAAAIQVKPTTYNTYETGRTEPPAEILVRLSHLYRISIDILVARDRIYRTSMDVADLLGTMKDELNSFEGQIQAAGENQEALTEMKNAMLTLVEQIQQLNENPSMQKLLNKHTGGNT